MNSRWLIPDKNTQFTTRKTFYVFVKVSRRHLVRRAGLTEFTMITSEEFEALGTILRRQITVICDKITRRILKFVSKEDLTTLRTQVEDLLERSARVNELICDLMDKEGVNPGKERQSHQEYCNAVEATKEEIKEYFKETESKAVPARSEPDNNMESELQHIQEENRRLMQEVLLREEKENSTTKEPFLGNQE